MCRKQIENNNYIKNKKMYYYIKEKGILRELRKYPEICDIRSIGELKSLLRRKNRRDLLERLDHFPGKDSPAPHSEYGSFHIAYPHSEYSSGSYSAEHGPLFPATSVPASIAPLFTTPSAPAPIAPLFTTPSTEVPYPTPSCLPYGAVPVVPFYFRNEADRSPSSRDRSRSRSPL